MISCFAEIEFFRFWPKTMDYSKAFQSKFRTVQDKEPCSSGYLAEAVAAASMEHLPLGWWWQVAFSQQCRAVLWYEETNLRIWVPLSTKLLS